MGARTRVIAARAGITEAILYQYFASKDELFAQAVLQPVQVQALALSEALHRCVVEGVAADGTPLESAGEGVEAVLTSSLVIVLGALESMLPLLGVAVLANRREGASTYRADIHRAVTEVLADVDAPLAPVRTVADDSLMLTVLAMCLGPVIDAHFREAELDVPGVAGQAAALLVHGLARPPVRGTRRPTPRAVTAAPRKPRRRSGS